MPLTLLLLRHAKSSRDNSLLADHDRPLDERGLRDAPRMGQLLAREHLSPDMVISSTAKRAHDTAHIASDAGGYPGQIQLDRRLYGASTDTIIQVLKEIPEGNNTILLVGHNPDLENFVSQLTKSYAELPTAALVKLQLPIQHWKDLTINTKATIENIWRPKEIKDY